MADAYTQFRNARDLLLSLRTDYDRAVADYSAPRPPDFNWGLDELQGDPRAGRGIGRNPVEPVEAPVEVCLLYTSDAADG